MPKHYEWFHLNDFKADPDQFHFLLCLFVDRML